MGQTRVTIREVAARAGFSITTVSHVLNEVPGKRIPDSTRMLVKAVADDLGYRPNRLAQGLRLQRSDTIGFISDWIATSPHAGQTIVGAQQAASEYGSLLLLMNSGTDADLETREIRALLDRQVDGIIYAAEYHRLVTPPALLHDTHAVLLDARATGSDWAYAVPDEVGGALTAVGALLEQGHRNIGHLSNVDDIPATAGRLDGYRTGLSRAGIAPHDDLVVAEESDATGGYRAAMALLDRPNRPTALFCFNDRMAMGAYQAATALGLAIPQDLSIVGFDDQEIISAGLRPGLTTVALPHREMGQWAVHTLMRLIKSDGREAVEPVVLPCPLVRRASVGSPPGTCGR
ncbi:MAG TPA: LacI family DNA-binding transcriptional regulator [Nakamurella sp.]